MGFLLKTEAAMAELGPERVRNFRSLADRRTCSVAGGSHLSVVAYTPNRSRYQATKRFRPVSSVVVGDQAKSRCMAEMSA